MSTRTPITVASGDGIGPEIMAACLHVLEEAGAQVRVESIEIGEKVYRRGNSAGIDQPAWDAIRRTGVLYKGPVAMPPGAGFKSLPVTLRKGLGLFANVRPCISYHPFVPTQHPGMNVVIIRENEEDLYTGMEYQISPNVVEGLKVVSRQGVERICRFAFGYARKHGRNRVTCFTKSNLLRMSDGLFQRVFEDVGAGFAEIGREHMLVDAGGAKLAQTPEAFDIIVTSNLYGDILSDVAAQIAGPIAVAPSACIGAQAAMFEAIHGSAPKRAGQDVANPSGLLLSGVMMLAHLGQIEQASLVHNAWLKTIEDGLHTYDMFREGISTQQLGTKDFATAVIERLGLRPEQLSPVEYTQETGTLAQFDEPALRTAKEVRLVGADVFVLHKGAGDGIQELADAAARANGGGLKLQWIDARGVKVWPETAHSMPATAPSDSFRIRYMSREFAPVSPLQVTALLDRMAYAKLTVVRVEYLNLFDNQSGFSLSQGS
jgi:isocitrate dehydrogenase